MTEADARRVFAEVWGSALEALESSDESEGGGQENLAGNGSTSSAHADVDPPSADVEAWLAMEEEWQRKRAYMNAHRDAIKPPCRPKRPLFMHAVPSPSSPSPPSPFPPPPFPQEGGEESERRSRGGGKGKGKAEGEGEGKGEGEGEGNRSGRGHGGVGGTSSSGGVPLNILSLRAKLAPPRPPLERDHEGVMRGRCLGCGECGAFRPHQPNAPMPARLFAAAQAGAMPAGCHVGCQGGTTKNENDKGFYPSKSRSVLPSPSLLSLSLLTSVILPLHSSSAYYYSTVVL